MYKVESPNILSLSLSLSLSLDCASRASCSCSTETRCGRAESWLSGYTSRRFGGERLVRWKTVLDVGLRWGRLGRMRGMGSASWVDDGYVGGAWLR